MPTFQTPNRYRAFAVRSIGLALCVFVAASSASELRQTPIVRAANSAAPAVVNIHGHKTVDGPNESGEYEGPRRVNGMGTGVVIDERGYIVTNHHVIEGVRRIQVTLADRRTYTARLIARDPQTDLAIIRVNPNKPLPLINIGRSDDLMPGEPVIAVGNAYGYHHSVTQGIISALDRTVEVTDSQKYFDLIQTDASINPGNSGGPLINIDGKMVGINVAVRVGAQGIGFAIPVDKVMEVAARLMRVEQTSGTWHGIHGETLIQGERRIFKVQHVREGSPAAEAGIRGGDYLGQIGKTRIERALDIERALMGLDPGQSVSVRKLGAKSDTERVTMKIASAPNGKRRTPGNRVERDAWDILGLRVAKVGPEELAGSDETYNGGLRVLAVRTGSPASSNGIRSGDILVGMHIWETISMENLDYIMNKAKLDNPNAVKFFVVRNTRTKDGEISVARRER